MFLDFMEVIDGIIALKDTYDVQGKYSRIPPVPGAFVLEILKGIFPGRPAVSPTRTQH